jgi:hypothetical protein
MTAMPTDLRASETERVAFGTAEVFRARLFSAAESVDIVEAVDRVPESLRRPGWNFGGTGLQTIGEALYRNRQRFDHYAECARADNRPLYQHFRWVYERLAGFFEQRYRRPVVFAEDLAVPGFHLFEYSQAGDHDGGAWHFDLLADQVPFLADHRDEVEAVLNFTLPVEVPSGGTGMDLFDDEPGPGRPGGGVGVSTPYVAGVLVFNEREYWHRIGGSTCRRDGERRITLQGHGVQFRGRVILFW